MYPPFCKEICVWFLGGNFFICKCEKIEGWASMTFRKLVKGEYFEYYPFWLGRAKTTKGDILRLKEIIVDITFILFPNNSNMCV
jgi:hypothetical protein